MRSYLRLSLLAFGLGLAGSVFHDVMPRAVTMKIANADDTAATTPTVDFVKDVKPILALHCYACHSVKAQKANLRVDTGAALILGGDSGTAVEAGKPDESLFLQAITGAEGVARMPPKEPRLSAEEVAVLTEWVKQGAKIPEGEIAPEAEVTRSKHWSFLPIQHPAPPAVKGQDWVRNPIDAFVLARLESQDILPAPEADRATLIRRLSLDLLGLPPTPEEVDEFLADGRPDAYEHLVDRLLASPHYGERWGRKWLDLARYADSNGFTRDFERSIWHYREWVINALNRDLPFDQFTIEQMAGDMLPDATRDQIIATGFHRNTLINEEGGTDNEQFRVEAVVDRVSTTGTTFLGLTIGCAQCHDHKYDPISQREFYQLYAFLNSAADKNGFEPTIEVPTPEQEAANAFAQRDEIRKQIAALEAKLKEQADTVASRVKEWEKGLSDEDKKGFPFDVVNALQLSEEMREDKDRQRLIEFYKTLDTARKEFPILDDIAQLQGAEPKFAKTMVMKELPEPRETFIQVRGDFLRPGARVEPAVPAVFPPLPEIENPTRLDLARWLVNEKNPLTARVTVNRIWQGYFGRGLVETENDFGLQGTPPTHPQLLDWLASEFMARGWSMKALHKLIVMSATYRQSSRVRPELIERDPRNHLLARQMRLRLDAELIRDSALAASGLLSRDIGGPSVFPPQPDGVFDFTQDKKAWKTETGSDRYRRALYTFLWRSSPYPAMTVFDFPDANIACSRRNRSNTPLQSLTLANDTTFLEFAQGLAVRVLNEKGDDTERLQRAFRMCLIREPNSREAARLGELLASQRSAFAADVEAAALFVPEKLPEGMTVQEAAAWTAVARVLLNLDEFITRE